MGLTHVRPGGGVRKQDVGVAKNYLQPDELDRLNRIVTAYLEFAELQARGRKPMHMADWIAKLDDFLRLSDREVLRHAGTMSHEAALLKAETEFEAFRAIAALQPHAVDTDFDAAIKKVNALPAAKRKKGGPV